MENKQNKIADMLTQESVSILTEYIEVSYITNEDGEEVEAEKVVDRGRRCYYNTVEDRERLLENEPEDIVSQVLEVWGPEPKEKEYSEWQIKAIMINTISELENACRQNIEQGQDIELAIGKKHFSFTVEDQINISTLYASIDKAPIVEKTMPFLPYHADNEACTLFSITDITILYLTMQKHITYHTTYFNLLKQQITESFDINEEYFYGMSLNDKYSEQLNTIMDNLNFMIENMKE